MAQYFDPSTQSIKRQAYSWDDTNDSSASWSTLTSWETGNGAFYTLQSGDPIEFTTDILDYGRAEYINPLCTVTGVGTSQKIEVWAAESIDSSSQISGTPDITVTGSGQVLNGTYGRYFQFRVSLQDTATELAEIQAVETNLSGKLQQEVVVGDSGTHGGTQAARIAPLTREYSRIAAVVGNAKADTGITPFVTIGNNTSQAVYTVYDFTEAGAGDSSTVVAIADYTGNVTTITESGDVTAQEVEYKWQPSAIQFNSNDGSTVTDGDGKLVFDSPSLMGNTYTYEFWCKIFQEPGGSPGFAHPDHMVEIQTSTTTIRLRSGTSSQELTLSLSIDGGSSYTTSGTLGSGDTFRHIAIVATGSAIKVYHNGNDVFPSNTFSHSGQPQGQCSVGDLGTGTGHWWMDDWRISDNTRYTGNFSTPGEFVEDANTTMLINGIQEIVPGEVSTNVSTVDATVNLLVTGLPKLVSDSNSNIIEEL